MVEQFLNLPNADTPMVIHFECRECGAADVRQPHYLVAVPSEVLVPIVRARVEQTRLLAGRQVRNVHTIGLLEIAARAKPRPWSRRLAHSAPSSGRGWPACAD